MKRSEVTIKIRIYQINYDRDKLKAMFRNSEYLERTVGELKPDRDSYDLVFEGEVECVTLDDVFRMFNLNHPADYIGRSLSVSDVVEVVSDHIYKSGFYFCDSCGFEKVPFELRDT